MIDRYEELIKRVLMGSLKEDGGEGAATAPEGTAPKYADGAEYAIDGQCREGEWFKVDADGVYLIRLIYDKELRQEKEQRPKKIAARVDVVGKSCNQNGGGWGRVIVFKDGIGRERRLTVSMKDILSGGAALSQALGEAGLAVFDISAANGMAPLNRFINSFPLDDLPTIKTVDGGGWTDETFSCFVFGDGLTVQAEGSDRAELAAGAKAPIIKTRGTLEDWQRVNAEIARHSMRLSFAVAAALAAPVLPIVGDMSRIFHFYGQSSGGKTSLMLAAASVWGDKTFKRSWDTTKAAPAALAKMYNNLPLIFDELKAARDIVKDVGYMIGNGQDRSRSDRNGNAREARTWSLYALSSGEGSLAEIKSQNCRGMDAGVATGELVRFIDIPAQADENDAEKGVFESFPEGLTVDGRSNWIDAHCSAFPAYGTAGVAFLRRLMDDIKAHGVNAYRETILAGVKVFEQGYQTAAASPTMGRVLKAFAIVAVVGEQAIAYGVLPWKSGAATRAAQVCFEAWRGSTNTPEDQESAFIENLKEDPKKRGASYQQYTETGEGTPPVGAQAALGRLITTGTKGNGIREHLFAFYDAAQLDDLIKRTANGLPKSNALAALKRLRMLCVTDEAKGKYRVRRKGSSPLAFGLTIGARYTLISFIEDKKRVSAVLEAAGLVPLNSISLDKEEETK